MNNQQEWPDKSLQARCDNCGTSYQKIIGHTCNVPSYIGDIKRQLDHIIKLLEVGNE